ncbi:hypothetical protein E5981_19090 [Bacteroides faecichinchillae]|nr:hypothetical protein E5981_19090 [Bacteroides faecichinchillae]
MKTIQLSVAVINSEIIEKIRSSLPLAIINKKGLVGNEILNAFSLKTFILANGESTNIGIINGLCVIRHSWSHSTPCVVIIDNQLKSIIQVAGRKYSDLPCNFIWGDEEPIVRTLSIESKYATTTLRTSFVFAYQKIGV